MLAIEIKSVADAFKCVSPVIMGVYEEHEVVIEQVIFVYPGTLPRSRLGEKQRKKLLAIYANGYLYFCVFYV